MRSIAVSLLVSLVLLASPRAADAREPRSVDAEDEAEDVSDALADDDALGLRSNVRTRAEEISFDARERTVDLIGNVRVDLPPFHLRSQRIRVARTKYGIEVDGRGSLAFCPCLGTPLKVGFDHAIVAPPGDLILTNPTLRFYDVPVFALPYFWMRSDEKLGVLPPDIAYRGQDGMFVGGGVHIPWKSGGRKLALDLRGGAYLFDGFAVDTRLRAPASATRIRFDRRPGAPAPVLPGTPAQSADEGLLVDARGSSSSGELGAAWDADVLRGRRGVAATTDLDAAAKPWDRAAIEGALRGDHVVVATAVRAVTRRGGGLTDVEAAGPIATVRSSGAVSSGITYDATAEGGSLRLSGGALPFGPIGGAPPTSPDAMSFVRAELGARAVATSGALESSLALRGVVDATRDALGADDGRAATARGRLAVPLAKAFEGDLVHVVEPFAELAVLHAKANAMLGLAAARGGAGLRGTAPIADVGLRTALGHWASRDGLELMLAGGAAYGSDAVASRVRPLARGRLSMTTRPLGASADAGTVFGEGRSESGIAVSARARVGLEDSVRILLNVATRGGLDPVLARALVDAPLEPAAGFLVRTGTTGGAGLVVPWSRVVTTSVGADGDLTARELVAARGSVELRDRCGCLTLRVVGSHRIGREGVDVWLALDFGGDR